MWLRGEAALDEIWLSSLPHSSYEQREWPVLPRLLWEIEMVQRVVGKSLGFVIKGNTFMGNTCKPVPGQTQEG